MPNCPIVEQLRNQVVARYRVPPDEVRVARAPYRICPLGAHIDHQLGSVTAMAIDRSVYVAFAPSHSLEMTLTSCDFPGEVRFSLTDVPAPQRGDWGNYARGAVLALQKKHHLHTGVCGITSGRLDGGGLSSSAAIGVALLLALEHANGLEISPQDNIDLDQAIENEYLGLRNGILDQAAILLSQRGQLTYIDCSTREYQLFPPPPNQFSFSILIVFSGLKQALTTTDYNRRVEECTAAAETLLEAAGRPHAPRVLRSIAPDEYAEWKHVLRGSAARRAEHFFGEMARVEQGVAAWRDGDLDRFGRLVSQSGRSSIEDYQCGCPPLIDLYEILCGTPGVLGARFSGAGFRGCCVALTEPGAGERAAEQVLQEYRCRQPELAEAAYTLVCRSDNGASLCE